ncbi:MAG: glyoxylase-like metal-dependent hydrolase (beta-lactamase superfamily II) [Myxococcota bacterium]|jgi:glyoxylase-like metal-dependent hydrolase (beta-lactamase superfamily II)
MTIEMFFDSATWTLTYLGFDTQRKDAVISDPVLDFDPLAVDVSTTSAQHVADRAEALGLTVHYVLDTQAHADHLSALHYLTDRLGAKVGVGAEIIEVQHDFKGILGFTDAFETDGTQWDVLLSNGTALQAGSLTIEPIHSPGHTPAYYVYKIAGALFFGDVLCMPDAGTGRCDFPGGRRTTCTARFSACMHWTHHFASSRDEYVAMRTADDATLTTPKLIFQSLKVNAKAGMLPKPEANGLRYFKMPLGIFSEAK